MEKYTLLQIKEKMKFILDKYCIPEDENYIVNTIKYTLEEEWLIDKLRDIVDYYEKNILTEEDKKEIIEFIIKNNVKKHVVEITREINKVQRQEEQKLYNKEDIMTIFSCESEKALKILRLAHQMGYTLKMGKEYYISREDFATFLDQIKGRNTIL